MYSFDELPNLSLEKLHHKFIYFNKYLETQKEGRQKQRDKMAYKIVVAILILYKITGAYYVSNCSI